MFMEPPSTLLVLGVFGSVSSLGDFAMEIFLLLPGAVLPEYRASML
jgi:hypothetical protein